MKNIVIWPGVVACILTIAFLAFVTQGCNQEKGLEAAYKTMSTSQIAYDMGMKMAADAYEKGEINSAQKEEIVRYGEIFYSSWMIANGAMQSWAENKESESAKITALKMVKVMINDFERYKTSITNIINNAALPEVK